MSASSTSHQGILSILESDHKAAKAAPSLRKTLSADMSSRSWRAQNGFSGMDSSSCWEDEEDNSEESKVHDHMKNVPEGQDQPGQLDGWLSLLNQRAQLDGAKTVPPATPYVHPLMKRSASCISIKSLLVCTESLGSESGSDGFSLSAPTNIHGNITEEEPKQHHQVQPKPMQMQARRKRNIRPFPPPIPSLSHQDGQALQVRSRRHLGRLVLEATSIPLQSKNFQAQREDGRLVLAFAHHTSSEMEDSMEEDTEDGEMEEDNTELETQCGSENYSHGNKGFMDSTENEEEEEENADSLTPLFKSCKDHWSSVLFREPHCIVTS